MRLSEVRRGLETKSGYGLLEVVHFKLSCIFFIYICKISIEKQFTFDGFTCETRARGEHVSSGEELVAAAVLAAAAHDAHVRVDREDDRGEVGGTRLVERVVQPDIEIINVLTRK